MTIIILLALLVIAEVPPFLIGLYLIAVCLIWMHGRGEQTDALKGVTR